MCFTPNCAKNRLKDSFAEIRLVVSRKKKIKVHSMHPLTILKVYHTLYFIITNNYVGCPLEGITPMTEPSLLGSYWVQWGSFPSVFSEHYCGHIVALQPCPKSFGFWLIRCRSFIVSTASLSGSKMRKKAILLLLFFIAKVSCKYRKLNTYQQHT